MDLTLISLLLLLLHLLFGGSLVSVQHTEGCNIDESLALLQFKESLQIQSFASVSPPVAPKTASWKLHIEREGKTANCCCSWDGVECDPKTGRVVGLDLESSFLYGSINSSTSLFNLVYLQRLNLAGNNFNLSEIPARIAQFSRLTYLNLRNSNFSGKLPSSLSNLTQLSFLSLAGNYNLDVVTLSWVGKLTKLTTLDFDFTNLRCQIPYSIANLTHLSSLHLSGNQLTGSFPYWLMNLTQLSQLHLSGNYLQGNIGSSISGFKHLKQLDLAGNRFSGTVELKSFLKLTNLTLLQLSKNNFSVLLPKPNPNVTLPKFEILGLGSCQLKEFPHILHNQSELFWLDLNNNNIHGLVPEWLWNGTKESLQYLDLDNNFLTGFEPSSVSYPWSALRVVRLSSNMLQGPIVIPSPSVEIFLASHNNLSGKITHALFNLSSLSALDLSYNNLSGSIPLCLGNATDSLSYLKLRQNNLHGRLPLMFTKESRLKMLDLGQNKFEGQLPRSLENCTMLTHIDVSSNQIYDSYPFWLGNLPYLKVLILRSNRFHGIIKRDSEMDYNFTSLQIIDFSHNHFNGEIPSNYFQSLESIISVDTQRLTYMEEAKYLSIEICGWVGRLHYSFTLTNKGTQREYEKIQTFLTTIDLSSNRFEGQIPSSIGHLQGLYSLNLSNNVLNGTIPPSLGNISMIESLDLSHNRLSGGIPLQLAELSFLSSLDVSYNNLSGPVPKGPQFNTFGIRSFDGNWGLCEMPFLRKCDSSEISPKTAEVEDSVFGFGWRVVLVGYSFGFAIAIWLGLGFTPWKHMRKFTG
ncbi:receptor like protein 27-like [Humulus lupulus]|uniref:receptor like protein 27-like n=1 Tax=Humulus lupulus TaxID=3486 RepID=UPI002B403DD9|nr:receptor like protein 27-like [Humulus lupulus]